MPLRIEKEIAVFHPMRSQEYVYCDFVLHTGDEFNVRGKVTILAYQDEAEDRALREYHLVGASLSGMRNLSRNR